MPICKPCSDAFELFNIDGGDSRENESWVVLTSNTTVGEFLIQTPPIYSLMKDRRKNAKKKEKNRWKRFSLSSADCRGLGSALSQAETAKHKGVFLSIKSISVQWAYCSGRYFALNRTVKGHKYRRGKQKIDEVIQQENQLCVCQVYFIKR